MPLSRPGAPPVRRAWPPLLCHVSPESDTGLVSNRSSDSMACRQIPYATEQGIFGAITGNFFRRTGNFLVRAAISGHANQVAATRADVSFGNDDRLGAYSAIRSWADCITNMCGFDLRHAQPSVAITEPAFESGRHVLGQNCNRPVHGPARVASISVGGSIWLTSAVHGFRIAPAFSCCVSAAFSA